MEQINPEGTNYSGEMDQYRKDLKEALMSIDPKTAPGKMYDFCKKYKVPVPIKARIFWVNLHKARVECSDLPTEERLISKAWLREREIEPFGPLSDEDIKRA